MEINEYYISENFSWSWFDYDLLVHSYEYKNPIFLYLALLIPITLIAFGIWRLIRKSSVNLDLLPSEYQFSNWVFLGLLPWFFFFSSISLLFIALARPQKSDYSQQSYLEGIDILLVLDISGSMVNGRDIEPNRLEKTKEMAIDFVEKREHDNIGLVVFSGEAFAKAPLTQDKIVLKEIIADISASDIQVPGTSIGNGCALGVSMLKDSKSISKVMILLSDGANQGGEVSPKDAAELANIYGVKIYTIGVGAPNSGGFFGGIFNEEVDFSELDMIAQITKGKFYQATTGAILENIFNEINQLERSKIEDDRYRIKTDFYQVYTFWSIIFMGLFILLRSSFLVGMHRE